LSTFKLANYEDKPDPVTTPVTASDKAPNGAPTTMVDNVETSEITIRGSIAEIVAKSLYSIFPNIETVSQEHHGHIYTMTVPKLSVESILVVTLAKETIVNDPVTSLRLANTPNALVFIDMQGQQVDSKEESWFYLNLYNEQYFSITALTNKVASLCTTLP
jgi:hypothetical protein